MAARRVSVRRVATRYSHSVFAAILLIFMLGGFRRFYVAGQSAITDGPILPDLLVYVVPHGIITTAWMLALVLQPVLVAKRQQKLHRTLGWWLLGLAVLVPISGALVAVNAPRVEPHLVAFGISHRDFMLVMLSEMAVFAGLVALAVHKRKRPQVHRSLMLLSGLALLSAATARIAHVMELTGHRGWWGMFAPELVLGLLFLAVRWALVGKLDRWFAGGLAVMMAVYFAAFQLATTAAWNAVVTSVLGF